MIKLHQVQEPPAIGLTLSRDLMPQIHKSSDFLKYLKTNGVNHSTGTVPSKCLKSTQSEFDDAKIADLMYKDNSDAIIVSNDNHVLDGHHRWLADHSTDGKTKAHIVDLPILELLRLAREYTAVSLKEEVTHKEFQPMMDSFVSFASDRLGVKSLPNIEYKADDDMSSFGGYDPKSNKITVHTRGRHPMDIFRTVAHEIVHHKQNEDGKIKDVSKEGATGSHVENEANAMAGQLMRHYAKANPEHFKLSPLSEAVFVVGVPCSGKDRIIRQLKENGNYKETDLNSLHKFNTTDKLIISCSADNLVSIQNANQFLKENDFATRLIFVDVSNDISKMRNEMRQSKGQRIINENVRFTKYATAKGNVNELHEIFKYDMIIIDNSREETNNGNIRENNSLPENREYGTTSLKRSYQSATPRESTQTKEEGKEKGRGRERERGWQQLREERGRGKEREGKDMGRRVRPKSVGQHKKLEKKRLNQEDRLPSAIIGNLPPDGIGDTVSVSKVPGILSGYGGAYSYSQYNESVQRWMNNQSTIDRFTEKYGDNAMQKLFETASEINSMANKPASKPKTLSKLRESFDMDIGLMGSVPSQGNKEDISKGGDSVANPSKTRKIINRKSNRGP